MSQKKTINILTNEKDSKENKKDNKEQENGKKRINRVSQRGLEDKIMYSSYNRGVDIISEEDSLFRPDIDPVVFDRYPERTSSDIVEYLEDQVRTDFLIEEYKKSEWVKIEQEDNTLFKEICIYDKCCREELSEMYHYFKKCLLNYDPNITEKEILYVICEMFEMNYSKVWKYVLTPVEKDIIMKSFSKKKGIKNRAEELF